LKQFDEPRIRQRPEMDMTDRHLWMTSSSTAACKQQLLTQWYRRVRIDFGALPPSFSEFRLPGQLQCPCAALDS
jgi:hypothetical protein